MKLFPDREQIAAKTVIDYWSARAATYDGLIEYALSSNSQQAAWLRLLARIAGPAPVRVLDVCCGTGFLALLLARLGHEVTGLDCAPPMVYIARERARKSALRVQFRVEDAARVREETSSYDLVIGRYAMRSLLHPARAVEEWLRVLRPDGRLALIDAGTPHTTGQLMPHERPERSASVRRYARVQCKVPFSRGVAMQSMLDFLALQGVRELHGEPLADRDLWGDRPYFGEYIVFGTNS